MSLHRRTKNIRERHPKCSQKIPSKQESLNPPLAANALAMIVKNLVTQIIRHEKLEGKNFIPARNSTVEEELIKGDHIQNMTSAPLIKAFCNWTIQQGYPLSQPMLEETVNPSKLTIWCPLFLKVQGNRNQQERIAAIVKQIPDTQYSMVLFYKGCCINPLETEDQWSAFCVFRLPNEILMRHKTPTSLLFTIDESGDESSLRVLMATGESFCSRTVIIMSLSRKLITIDDGEEFLEYNIRNRDLML